jgi:hypothetical protein
MKLFATLCLIGLVGVTALYVLYLAAWQDATPDVAIYYPEIELVTEQGLQPTVLGEFDAPLGQ